MKAFLLEAIQYRVEKEPQREEGKMQRGFGRWPQTIQDAAQKDEDDGVNGRRAKMLAEKVNKDKLTWIN